MMASWRPFLRGGALALLLPSVLHAAESPPNVLVILLDDLGSSDVGVRGGKTIPTPNIDSIATNGVHFTNGYATCPVCSPTRAGVVTGRYQQRFGFEFIAESAPLNGIPAGERTLAEALKTRNYKTGIVGKWHLGFLPQFRPTARGFDEYFGFLAGANLFLRPDAVKPGDVSTAKDLNPAFLANPIAKRLINEIYRGDKQVEEREYLTDAFTREAVSFIERHHQQHWFLYLTYNAPHTPLEATEKYLKRFEHLGDRKQQVYAAMVSAVDDGVGQVLQTLRKHKIEENTLIFFVVDNGGAPYPGSRADNGIFNGAKSELVEGGIRVPYFLQWKARVPAGLVVEHPVNTLDIFPTSIAAAGIPAPTEKPLDGVDLVPFLIDPRKAGQAPHEALYWRYGDRLAIRSGKWKLHASNRAEDKLGFFQASTNSIHDETLLGAPESDPLILIDLAADPSELKNVADQYPEVASALEKRLADWNKDLAPPFTAKGTGALFGSQSRRANRDEWIDEIVGLPIVEGEQGSKK